MYFTRGPVRASLDRSEVGVRALIVGLAAVGAGLADTAPTGHDGADLVWRILVAAVLTCAGCTCGPVARMVPAVVAAAISGSLEAWGVAAVACVILVASAVLPHRDRVAAFAGSVLVGASVSVLLRLPDLPAARGNTVLCFAAAIFVLLSGWRGAGRRTRRTVVWTVGLGGAAMVAMSVPFLVAGACRLAPR